VIDSTTMIATSDVVIGLFVAIPVAVVAVGVGAGLRFRGSSGKARVPPGEVASDAPTDVELDRSAEATRRTTEVDGAHAAPVAAEPVAAEPAPAEPEPPAVVEPITYRARLGKARGLLAGYLGSIRSKGKVDGATWDDLEEALIRADVGVGATDALLDDLRTRVKEGEIGSPEVLVDALKADLIAMLTTPGAALNLPGPAPAGPAGADHSGERGADHSADEGDDRSAADAPLIDVWLFVGVNGVGKTTTVGKVANRLSASGTKVLLAAGDTFRAAAGEQLAMWASRADADIVRGSEGGDPSSVVFDAVQRAASKGHDVVLADTAGRLHNKVNLIEELKKIRRIADRPPGRVVEVLLVLVATTGQNGLTQAKVFLEAVDVSGVVLTKLDGTAKGGIVVAIQRELGLPVKLVGLGEGVDDLIDFEPAAFVDALF
jgi:fused signal recognition particle receptor